jgi:hypothetical protein
MFLEKWYADLVADGDAQVRYGARLRVWPMTIEYSGQLAHGRTRIATLGLRRHPMPVVLGDALHWPAGPDGPAAVWRGASHRSQQLLQDGARAISWDPVVLNGSVLIDGSHRPARGYVERLTLNFAPWHLGLETLKWGRFCGQQHSLVWIEWLGHIPMQLALLDGELETLEAAGRSEVRTQHAALAIGTASEIVSEALGSGALAALGGIRMFAARRFLAGLETKWLAEARLELHGEAADRGFVIYEEVVWP